MMTGLFSYFTGKNAPFHFPGVAFLLGAVLMLISTYFAYRSLHALRSKAS
jgi:DHA1 family tetracycline resistance protein-like MFS transporter